MSATVRVVGLFAGYGQGHATLGEAALRNVTIEVGAGVHVVVGANGSGKTTLLRVLAGVLPPLQGSYLVNGQSPFDDMATKARVGYAPHRSALYPSLTGRENLLFWSRAVGLDKTYAKRRIDACAKDFGLGDFLDQPARVLSRGRAQRLSIARAVLAEPLVLVLDEPAEGLDPDAVQTVNRALESTVLAGGLVFYSSHHLADVDHFARTIIDVRNGGVVVRDDGLTGRAALQGNLLH